MHQQGKLFTVAAKGAQHRVRPGTEDPMASNPYATPGARMLVPGLQFAQLATIMGPHLRHHPSTREGLGCLVEKEATWEI